MIKELKREIQSNLFLPNKFTIFLTNLPTPAMLRLPSQLVTKSIPSKLAEIVANIILFLSFLALILLKQIVTGTVIANWRIMRTTNQVSRADNPEISQPDIVITLL